MRKIFTIKEGVPIDIYGFESSQLARQEMCEFLGIEHTMVIANTGNYVANFVEALNKIGFKNFYHVLFDMSDIARDKPSVNKDFVKSLKNVREVRYTEEGFVGLVIYEDNVIECYTSQLLYRYKRRENKFELYDSKGLLITGQLSDEYHIYTNQRTKEEYTQWYLVNKYLAENSTVNDKFIIDMTGEYPLQLRRFFNNTKRELFAYTHYNITDPIMKYVLQYWCSNIVASPVLEERLGSDKVRFLPPVYVDEVKEKTYNKIVDWCLLGNISKIKRVEMAIEAFKKTPDSKLTIYGNLPEKYIKEGLPENIEYKGFVKNIPFEKHQGYLSCSLSECFANSAVEASAAGLFCLLSNTDLAHKYYSQVDSNVETFNTVNELIDKLKFLQNNGEYKSAVFSKLYTKENVANKYKEVFNLK